MSSERDGEVSSPYPIEALEVASDISAVRLVRPVRVRDSRGNPDGAGMGLALEWGEITFNLRLGAEQLLVNTSPIPAPQNPHPVSLSPRLPVSLN